MKLSIGKKLGLNTVIFSLVAIIPFVIMGIMAVNTARHSFIQDKFEQLISIREIKKGEIERFFKERQGEMDVLVETVGTFRKNAFDKLTAVRGIKHSAVEHYFKTIENQILTFSESKMIVDAMQEFSDTFTRFHRENNISPAELKQMRQELFTYYTNEFSQEYQNQNQDESPDAQRFFNQLDDDSIALQYHYIRANKNPLGSKHLLERSNDSSSYSELHARIHPIIKSYLEKFGFYDIFLVDPESGDIVYSVFKELDYSTSLINGPYAGTNFGKAFQKANAANIRDAVVLVDYARYTPSYEAPAGFIASPIFSNGKKIGIAMFQMPIDRLNAIMNERDGLGETGETYLVGPDHLMRSDSYLDPERHSVAASFKHPDSGRVDTDAVDAVFSGKTGAKVVIDYNGNPVLSAYMPVKFGSLTWGLLAEIDVAEAFSPKNADNQEFFAAYKEKFGYYDLFLINADGYAFYTVAREADFQTNLLTGKYRSSNLGKLVKQVLDTRKFGLADFAPYAPSNNEPAAFIAQPVIHDNKVEIVAALQISLEAINKIMQQREGMGETGETYLVGPDHLMRCDSWRDQANHSVSASFADPSSGSVKTAGVSEALEGRTGQKIITDYNDRIVLCAYAPVSVGHTIWALLAEISEKEVVSNSIAARALLKRVWVIGIASMVVIIGMILVSFYIGRNLSKTLTRVIEGLNSASNQVASAAGQLSSSSQSLAEGASEQAASIEETSASMEEMAAVTKSNTQHAGHADNLMKETIQVVGTANTSMGRLAQSMQDISTASEKTSDIIKTIDEIAFQTNLLALNAAVEAARAGEAGAGFAVVADEVRNLAMRAADAAKDTARLIEETVKKVRDGSELVSTTNDDFADVAQSSAKVGAIISEISVASKEQASGIEQVNLAVMEMDKVVQQNAANAEESASASEEMRSQAEKLKDYVGKMVELVTGKSAQDAALNVRSAAGKVSPKPERLKRPSGHGNEIRPDQVIAFDDDENF